MRFRFRDAPLFWQLLVPFAALILIVGAFGAFLVVRDLNSRARTDLNQDLHQASLEARAFMQHRELYLLESADLAANVQGMADVVRRGDTAATTRLLRGVIALKTELDLVVVASPSGIGLAEFTRPVSGGAQRLGAGTSWRRADIVRAALGQASADRQVGLLSVGDQRMLAIAAPICTQATTCASAGVAIVGLRVDRLASQIAGRTEAAAGQGLAIYDEAGELLALTGPVTAADTSARPTGRSLIRRTQFVDGTDVHTLYAPLEVQGRKIGIVAVSLPSKPALAPVRSVALRVTFVMLAALIGIMGLGALVSRRILRQVRPLVEANRALGAGDLSARVPVLTGNEIGEVARGLNQMAEQLQASHQTLELRVAQRTEEVQRLLGERTEFFASLSHELRTPLAIILNESDALLQTGSSKNATSARAIKLSGAQLLAVVNDILELAKAEVGRLKIKPAPLQLADAISDLRPTLEGLARAGSLRLRISIPDDLPPVSADEYRLRQILLNLVDNAVKYTPANGRVTLSALRDDEMIRIELSDTGPGIPAAVGARVFEPFFRVKGTDARGERASSGLGLALTRRLVEAHGGQIWIEDNHPHGTTFAFTLPVLAAHARPTVAAEGKP